MKIINVLKQRKYLVIAIISSVMFISLYVYTQVLGVVQNIDLWLTVIPWYNAILFLVLAALFGIALSYQIYVWRQPKICSVNKKAKGAGFSTSVSSASFFVAQCPACASLGALFLPVSVMGVFTKFSWVINLISIGLLLFVINYLGGFRK